MKILLPSLLLVQILNPTKGFGVHQRQQSFGLCQNFRPHQTARSTALYAKPAVREWMMELESLEKIQNSCTEEGNQTNPECDLVAKADREARIDELTSRIALSRTDVDQVKECLSAPSPCSVEQMIVMLADLERVNDDCTEEGRQTDAICDVELKAEREALIEQLSYAIAKSRTDVDQVKACLASPTPCSLPQMMTMLADLERVNDECTEEGNQTDPLCDIALKAEREALIEKLSYQISKSRTDVDKVKECLAGPTPCAMEQMMTMLADLERVNDECTEEGNQTDALCDVELKAEREALIEKLQSKIAKSRTDVQQVKACLASPDPCGLNRMVTMLADLERVNDECTEEGNQTDPLCDVELKAEREALMEQLSFQISKSRTDVDQVKECLQGPTPCSVDQMITMLADLERVNDECTEEGHQTDSLCDVHLKAEREELMEELSTRIAAATKPVFASSSSSPPLSAEVEHIMTVLAQHLQKERGSHAVERVLQQVKESVTNPIVEESKDSYMI